VEVKAASKKPGPKSIFPKNSYVLVKDEGKGKWIGAGKVVSFMKDTGKYTINLQWPIKPKPSTPSATVTQIIDITAAKKADASAAEADKSVATVESAPKAKADGSAAEAAAASMNAILDTDTKASSGAVVDLVVTHEQVRLIPQSRTNAVMIRRIGPIPFECILEMLKEHKDKGNNLFKDKKITASSKFRTCLVHYSRAWNMGMVHDTRVLTQFKDDPLTEDQEVKLVQELVKLLTNMTCCFSKQGQLNKVTQHVTHFEKYMKRLETLLKKGDPVRSLRMRKYNMEALFKLADSSQKIADAKNYYLKTREILKAPTITGQGTKEELKALKMFKRYLRLMNAQCVKEIKQWKESQKKIREKYKKRKKKLVTAAPEVNQTPADPSPVLAKVAPEECKEQQIDEEHSPSNDTVMNRMSNPWLLFSVVGIAAATATAYWFYKRRRNNRQ